MSGAEQNGTPKHWFRSIIDSSPALEGHMSLGKAFSHETSSGIPVGNNVVHTDV